MPYKFNDIFGWFGFQELYKDMVDIHNDCIFVEIGCFQGKSSIFLAECIQELNKNIDLFCVDLWPDLHMLNNPEYMSYGIFQGEEKSIAQSLTNSLYHTFLTNIINTQTISHINIIRDISWNAAQIFNDNSLSFVFIDAGHSYTQVKKDIIAWYPKVKYDGYISGDDFVFSVKDAVLELLPNACQYKNNDRTWFFQKKT